MNKAGVIGKRIFIALYLIAVHALAGLFIYDRFVAPYIRTDNSFATRVKSPTEESPQPTIIPVPSIIAETADANRNIVNSANDSFQEFSVNSNQASNRNDSPSVSSMLMIPVIGVRRGQLLDTFSDSRSEGRLHDAIDIPAPAGTPVVAAVNGEIAKFFDSKAGGITIYQYSADKKFVYYYAHLQKRADNIKEKDYVTQGTVIGYVGDTGNSGAGNYHLHFSIARLDDPKRYWEGEYLNPYPLLLNALEAR